MGHAGKRGLCNQRTVARQYAVAFLGDEVGNCPIECFALELFAGLLGEQQGQRGAAHDPPEIGLKLPESHGARRSKLPQSLTAREFDFVGGAQSAGEQPTIEAGFLRAEHLRKTLQRVQ